MSASPVTLVGKNKRQLYPLKVLLRHPKKFISKLQNKNWFVPKKRIFSKLARASY